MTTEEVKTQAGRITEFRKLEAVRNEIQLALKLITEPWESGPCGQGPFTGNARESRRISTL